MPAVDLTKFGEFATKFRNHDPHVYEQFLRLLDAYTYEITVAVTQATPADILVKQGQAQQAIMFMRLLSEFREPKPKPTP
jgi:hypothetical protein